MIAGDLHIGTPQEPRTKPHSDVGMKRPKNQASEKQKAHMGAESSDLQVCLSKIGREGGE